MMPVRKVVMRDVNEKKKKVEKRWSSMETDITLLWRFSYQNTFDLRLYIGLDNSLL